MNLKNSAWQEKSIAEFTKRKSCFSVELKVESIFTVTDWQSLHQCLCGSRYEQTLYGSTFSLVLQKWKFIVSNSGTQINIILLLTFCFFEVLFCVFGMQIVMLSTNIAEIANILMGFLFVSSLPTITAFYVWEIPS